MKILLTGNNGYIGSVLEELLIDKGYSVTGLDNNYFADCIFLPVKKNPKQLHKDIRSVTKDDLKDIDFVIHLAGLANDPLGELVPNITEEINYDATVRFAKLAKESSIKRFIYASSQSMYGVSDTDDELDEDNSKKLPVTSYAKTKWKAEVELMKMNSENFIVSCFRPSTVFGASPRFRCDIVYNNLIACAYTTGKIEILSDGSPWRPVVHVRDVCKAFIAGLEAPEDLVAGISFNVGIPDGNFTIRNLAESAQKVVPGSELVFLNEHTDPRSYRVSFKRILESLSDYFVPEWNLENGGEEIVTFFNEINFKEKDFRGNKGSRIKKLEHLIDKNIINKKLLWT